MFGAGGPSQDQILGLMALGDAFSSLGQMGGGPRATSRAMPAMLQLRAREEAEKRAAEQEAEANAKFARLMGLDVGQPASPSPAAAPAPVAPPSAPITTQPLAAPGFSFDNVRDALVKQESGGNPNAVSPKGAVGLTQIMPATARDPGYGVPNIFDTARGMGVLVADESDATLQQLLRNPQVNEAFGRNYFNAMSRKYGGDQAKTLAAYNAGPGAVDEYGGVPPYQETQNYVAAIAPQISAPAPVAPPTASPAAPAGRYPPEIKQMARDLLLMGDRAGAKKVLMDYAVGAATQGPQQSRIIKGADGFNYTEVAPGQFERTIPGIQGSQNDPIAALNARADAAGLAPGSPERRAFMLNNGAMPDDGPDYEGESELRKEFNGLQTVKDFRKQATAFGRIAASAENPSPAGDLSMIFNFMKVLDPGSVVRESEFATAESASKWLQESEEAGITVPLPVASAIRRLSTGQRLSPEQRQDFVGRAGMLYKNAEAQYQGIFGQYQNIAQQRGFNPATALIDYRYQAPERPPAPASNPVVIDGYTIQRVD